MILKGGTIIDVNSGNRIEGFDIEIIDRNIARIERNITSSKEEVVDCSGKYIIPGLTDMHTHLGPSKKDLEMYLKCGVTSIRNMIGIEKFDFRRYLSGTRVFNHLKLRNEVEKGSIKGPTIYTAGPLIDGEDSNFPDFLFKKITTKDEAEKEVRRQKKLGYEFIKIYPSINKEVFYSILQEAENLGLKVCGHIPYEVGIIDAIKAGLYIPEHLHGVVYPLKPELNPDNLEDIAETLLEQKTWICPTLIAWKRMGNKEKNQDYENEEEFKKLSPTVKFNMRLLNKMAIKKVEDEGLKPQHRYLPRLKEFISKVKKSGRVLAGTDSFLPYVIPGYALLREIINLTEAGLTNLEALQSATINPAKCLEVDDKTGSISVGKVADLVVLNADPLEDISNIKRADTVIKYGKVVFNN